MANMLKICEMAENWQISGSRLSRLCRENRLDGAQKVNGEWMIPEDAARPDDQRKKRQDCFRRPNNLPLPIGISDYRKASTEYYYVDKTLMIRDFLDEVPMVSLFTRPRRFGKTLNMDMLRTFFEKTDTDTSIYFKNRKIWQCGEKVRSMQGRFPVVFLSFKDIKSKTWAETREMIIRMIVIEYKRHRELADPACNSDVDFYDQIVGGTASDSDYMLSLFMLTKMLHEVHKTEPIVIIDEYDTPIQQGHSCDFYDDVILFVRNLFSGAFKDNNHLKYGFLTGILRVGKESIFSGLNNLKVYSVLENRYSEYFGFTKDEVLEMAKYYGVPDKYDEICDWYDGYRFGRREIFNPWSVINYFSNDCKPGAYWQSTGNNDVIGEMLKAADNDIYDHLYELMQGKSFMTAIDTSVIYPQIQRNSSSIYSFLLVAGYLKAEEAGVSSSGDLMCNVSLPNKEITLVYNKEILSQVEDIVSPSLSTSIQAAIFANNSEKLKQLLEKLLRESVSFHDTAKESFYHGLVLGLCATFGDGYLVSSNREAGDGRFDIQIMPENVTKAGYIFELKATKKCSANDLAKLAQEALKQINDRFYDTEMRQRGITEIIKYGVAFSGKNVQVVSEE